MAILISCGATFLGLGGALVAVVLLRRNSPAHLAAKQLEQFESHLTKLTAHPGEPCDIQKSTGWMID
jgi:hypothetical protein